MEPRGISGQLDPLLLPFVEAVDETRVQDCLEELLERIAPAIKKIVRRTDSPEDDFQESLQQIIHALWKCKADRDAYAIADFERYVLVTASHTAQRRLRARRPAYHALKESLRHTLRNDARFALWQEREQAWVCGLTAQRDQPAFKSERFSGLLQRPLDHDEAILPGRDTQTVPQGELLAAIFSWVGHVIGFEALVNIVYALRRIEEARAIIEDEDDEARLWSGDLPSPGQLPNDESEWRQFLTALWTEIEQLPPLQRIAYLLNFTVGDGALEIFRLYGVASVRRIGAAAQLSEEQFARVWNDPAMDEAGRKQAAQLTSYDERFVLLWSRLPLSDQTIARLLGTERQKVINLRKAAGDRLARRLAAFKQCL